MRVKVCFDFFSIIVIPGRVAKGNINGHPAANGYLMVTLRMLRATRKGAGHPHLTMPTAQDKCPL